MVRRADPERIHEARRAAALNRLIGEGELPERAAMLIAQWEVRAAAESRTHDRAYWEAFDGWRKGLNDRGRRPGPTS